MEYGYAKVILSLLCIAAPSAIQQSLLVFRGLSIHELQYGQNGTENAELFPVVMELIMYASMLDLFNHILFPL